MQYYGGASSSGAPIVPPATGVPEMKLRLFARAFGAAAVIVVATSSSAAAQGFGIKFGPTFTEFSSDALDYNNRTGIHGGLFFGGNRDGLFGLQSELNWIRKRGEVNANGQQIKIDYLQVPVLLRLNLGSSSSSGPSLYGIAGPAVDIKVADEVEGIVLDDGFEGVDVTLVVGGGIEIARIILEGRYDKGFRRINRTFDDIYDIRKETFTILAGIRFR
jgi:hypothetical protein